MEENKINILCGVNTFRKIKEAKLRQNLRAGSFATVPGPILKAGTHEGACSRSMLLQHAPGAKLPRLQQRFLAKKYVAQQNVCSRVLLPHIKLVWNEGARSRGKSVARFCFRSKLPRVYWNLLCGSVFQEQAPSCVLVGAGACFRSKLPRVYWNLLCGSVFQEQAPSCVLVGILTRERVSGVCFRSKLLRVYWLEYLPGSVFQEQAPSCGPATEQSDWLIFVIGPLN